MKKYILAFGFIVLNFLVFSQQPAFKLKASGGVSDFVYENDFLYVATDNGKIDVFNTKTKQKNKSITVPNVKDFMGDEIPAKIYSVDVLENENRILIVSQGKGGFRDVYVFENNALNKILDANENKMMIRKARFINGYQILFALMSSEIILFDLANNKEIYKNQISTSTFSDFVLSEDLKSYITSDESGIIRKFETSSGKLIKEFKGENVDNVYQVDFKNNVIIGAGQDRRVSVYQNINSSYYLQSDFLVYSVGLSPSGKLGAYQKNEENEIAIFDIESKNILKTLPGHQTTLTKLLFISESELISSSDDPEILFWKL